MAVVCSESGGPSVEHRVSLTPEGVSSGRCLSGG